jgi:hypothetical protein
MPRPILNLCRHFYCQVGTSSLTTIEIRGLKKDSSYNFRVIAKNLVGCSEPFIIEETFTAAKADIPKSKNPPYRKNKLAPLGTYSALHQQETKTTNVN